MKNEGEPYIFLTQGDLSLLRADAVVAPTSMRKQGRGAVFESLCSRFGPTIRQQYKRGSLKDGGFWIDTGVDPKCGQPVGIIVVPSVTSGSANPKSVKKAAKDATAIAVQLMRQRRGHRIRGLDERALIAMPTLGTGKGAGRSDAKLAEAQLKGIRDAISEDDERDFDVAIVTYTATHYSVFAHSRRKIRMCRWSDWVDAAKLSTIAEISDAIRNDACVLFLGAGASNGSGLPDWYGLVAKMLEKDEGTRRAFLRRLPHGRERDSIEAESDFERLREAVSTQDTEVLLATAEHFAGIRKRNELGRHLELVDRVLGEDATKHLPPSVAHYLLLQLPFQYVVTTNFDLLVEQTLAALRRSTHVVVEDRDVAGSGEQDSVTVFKIHGSVAEPQSPARTWSGRRTTSKEDRARALVLTSTEFERFAVNHEAKSALLHALLLNHHFLFYGYSLSDPDLTSIRDSVGNMLGDTQRPAWRTAFSSSSNCEEVNTPIHPLPVSSPRDLAITLDVLAARSVAAERSFLGDPDHSQIPELETLFKTLRDVESALSETWKRRETWSLDEVRVLGRTLEALTRLGSSPKSNTARIAEWWEALADRTAEDRLLRQVFLKKGLAAATGAEAARIEKKLRT